MSTSGAFKTWTELWPLVVVARLLAKRSIWRSARLKSLARVSLRQERVPGFDQSRLSAARVLLIGAGCIGGQIGEGLTMKGVGDLHICDHDVVTPTNLNRQLFDRSDLYKPKAPRLCRQLSRRGFMGTRLHAHVSSFQESVDQLPQVDLVVAGVDNQIPSTRLDVSRFCNDRQIPAVVLGVTEDAGNGYVMIQEPHHACWACAFKPEQVHAGDRPLSCPETGACIDILKLISGIALYGIDTLLMPRQRDWNYWYVSLSKGGFGGGTRVERRPDCPVCGTGRNAL